MLKTRIIPCLQLINGSLVKTVKFDKYGYIGDYINTVRIFNELEVDELCFLDIRATKEKRRPNIEILHQIADECFMPLSYGGGIDNVETAKQILSIGFEKIVINTAAAKNPGLITKLSEHFGAQAVVASIDVKKNIWGTYQVYINDGTEKLNIDPVKWAAELEQLGAGEILLTSIDREGTWSGFDIELTKKIASVVGIPVIANGGAGSIEHIAEVIKKGNASAVALGSMLVYQKKGMGVLVNFPDKEKLNELIYR
ncbi:MAG: imidazole glycerol phosphate synthase subunit HisF [Chitinophagaceae bacterium]|nr:imidazole glycerol phosphate synthase subunit HisF [Chitinophagaceae bacterium]MDB5222747.1 imidazole glycerol phosphate synthase subunit HisF [Chitinophagaceae bacterium]